MTTPNVVRLIVLLLSVAVSAVSSSAQIKLHGAAALAAALKPHQAAIEATSGQKIVIVSKNAGLGVQDLLDGRSDLAMVTASLKGAAAGIKADPAALAGLEVANITADPLVFVVHPANEVSRVTADQIRGILTGSIVNWKDVGGSDIPIKVFGLANVNGPRIALNEQLLGDAELAPGAAIRQTPRDIALIVAQVPEGFGFLGRSNLGPGVKVLATDRSFEMAMLIVSKGVPTAEQSAVIEACRKALAVR